MRRRSLIAEIVLGLLVAILLAVVAATWNMFLAVQRFQADETAKDLESRARLAARVFRRQFDASHSASVDALCDELGALSETRITVILPDGQVIGDSQENPAEMDNHGDRPEVKAALMSSLGVATRYSHTLRTDLVYVAIPVIEEGQTVGIVRTSLPLASLDMARRQVLTRGPVGGLAAAGFVALVGLVLSQRVKRPLMAMKAGAQRFVRGDFGARLSVMHHLELDELASAMNIMASQLRDRICAVKRQRSELDAVLSGMAESVVAVDENDLVILVNRAAAALFGVHLDSVRGRPFQEVVRNPKLQQCVKRAGAGAEPFEDDVVLADSAEIFLHVFVSPLRDEQGQRIGTLLVLNDVTEVRRLERARSDFIANVSHEIRTPVTSIKGYAETLLGEEPPEAETARRFLETILRQADRLSNLVEDILSLASLERSEASGDMAFEPVAVSAIIEAAVNVCEIRSKEKGLRVRVLCPEDAEAWGHAFLLEQAVTNLLDNAIKYSEAGSEITVEVERGPGKTAIHVRDTGIGIAQEHLPRIFERFYRVDKARSRRLGGTGLGLAIVKHIANLHGGKVTVASALGKGSCFTICLPAGRS